MPQLTKLKFLLQVNEKYKPDTVNIDNAIKDYTENKNSRSILNLSRITSGTRKELFVRLNMAPNGTAEIVSLREDLLKIIDKNKDLIPLDDDLRELFKSWFNPGFLKLEKGASHNSQDS